MSNDNSETVIRTPDTLKTVHEALCFAQSANGLHPAKDQARHYTEVLQRLLDDIELQKLLIAE